MIGVIIFITIVAGVSNFLWMCYWTHLRERELDLQENAIQEARKMQDKVDEMRHETTGSILSNFIKQTMDGDD